MTESTRQSLILLRDSSNFQWYIIPILLLVIYIYAVEVEKRNWNVLLAGLAFWGMDWINEIWNSLVFHFTGYAPVWGAPTKSAYLILIGLNIEITLMFLVAGIACAKMLPKDKKIKILGIPNRYFLVVFNSILFVIVEIILNHIGVLTWEYSWWQGYCPWLIILIGYMPFITMCYIVHDMKKLKNKLITVGIIFSIDILGLIIFGPILNWI
ncbi:hypothetical protein SH1V18_24700 [Vallitalea longa]|uniref:Uncharacterized protein n=1 Tax=Vallitalea longa TaxID=2936439 RepID=A0A9W5YCC0_9FIRM|nr:hypothetical protein [Vallitalea longa]GKX29990.1 hypothetical protein SH1V18_24700 [Vallitalea longa]